MFCVLEKIPLRVLLGPSNSRKMKIRAVFAVLFAASTLLSAFAANSCLSCRQPREPLNPSYQVDLKNYKAYGSDSNIAWVEHLTGKPGTCATQGKLRIRFDQRCGPKRTVRIDLWFARKVTGFSFNIGDSPTVNGYGGDAGTTAYAAEIHGLNRKMLMYSNIKSGYLEYTTDNHLMVENKEKAISDHVTFYISHERVEVTNYRGYQAVYDSKYLFVLDGQRMSHPGYPHTKIETDIWLSMNRVISSSYRSGTGLCKVAISWV